MNTTNNKIAVIGMACRFPGADNLEEYWKNLLQGKESISFFTDEELAKFESDYESLKNNPDYVKARGALNNVDKFDAAFFAMTPKEAAVTDPQHRLWLEIAWDAFEHAGCDPINYNGSIGVFAGGKTSSYLLNNILRDPKRMENFLRTGSADSSQISLVNDISFIPTKTAYLFNLKGPAIYIQTACSTSLVTVVQACQSLYSYESDLCLAGGVSIYIPQEKGYIFQEGGIPSPDGHCRPFDAKAKGTVGSNGVGAVILKRLEDALRDHDTIYAVVSGWALNNDGNKKVSYAAPSVEGQAEVIMMAQSFAEVLPEEISYIEAHGTATQLGDPIELSALIKAFTAKTNKKQFCGVGSVKSNIGHTDSAAGIASFIKTCLSAYHKKIPSSINYSMPNPHINFEDSPFYVQKELKEWNEKRPLIMGVSSFGIGGTNAHVIVEEPNSPEEEKDYSAGRANLIVLSAKSEYSLNKRKQDLKEYLTAKQNLNFHDVAFTLGTGRSHMNYRSFLVASSLEDVISAESVFTDRKKNNLITKIAFAFPGQGAQYINMGKDLYENNDIFRNVLDDCFKTIFSETGQDFRKILFENADPDFPDNKLDSTEITQPALFCIEFALSKMLEEFGIIPNYLIGHSIGEYTAACLAGVFDLRTALKIVLKRGELMRKMPSGKMLAVRANVDLLRSISDSSFEIAADNAPESCTISFNTGDIEKVKAILNKNGIQYIDLKTSHAFHSEAFDPILAEFGEYVNQFTLNRPELPFISCLSGTYITDEEATSGNYWAKQLRNTVLFRQGVLSIATNQDVAFVEVGPNTHLSSLIRQNKEILDKTLILSTLGKADNADEWQKVLNAVGNIFNIGFNVNFDALFQNKRLKKISLPLYPFDRKRHWTEYKPSKVIDYNSSSVLEENPNENSPGFSKESSDGNTKDLIQSYSGNDAERIANIWKSLTGHDVISHDSDFFEIGGDSLLALQILTRIKEALGFKISLKEFLDNPTINKLSAFIAEKNLKQTFKNDAKTDVDLNHFPLSYIQKRIWIISQLDSANVAYNIPFTYHLKGDVNIDIFRQSLNVLFTRHFVLFSVFKHKEWEPYCEIIPKAVDIELIDFSNDPFDVSKEKIFSFIKKDSRKNFDLESGPLYRLYLLKQNDSNVFFHATFHHIIFDGWSFSVFNNDLKKIYDSLVLNNKLQLDNVEDCYYDYARRLKDNNINEETDINFWTEYLKGITPELHFPYDFPRKDVATGLGRKEKLQISTISTSKIKDLALKEHATPFSIMLTLMGILLKRYSGDDDFCIGTHVANRPWLSLEKIIGMFVNTIPVRLKIDEDQSLLDLIRTSKSALLETISHQELPFERIVEVVNPERSPNVNPIFQVSVQWINYSPKPRKFAGFIAEQVNVKDGVSPFDILFHLWENNGQIEGEIEYSEDLFKSETIHRLKDNFLHLVQSALENPNQKISEVSGVSQTDKEILQEFNNTEVPVSECLIQKLFEEQVERNPFKTAVVSGSKKLSYKELDDQSNRLANHMINLGIKPGNTVGVCLERSADMIIAVLGILKAGCGYLPLDPLYPNDRLSYMYKDSGTTVLISQNSLREKIDSFTNTSIISIDKDESEISKCSSNKPNLTIDTQSVAYMIYTSGSTGKPKGVGVHHKAVVNLIESMSVKPGINKDDILLAVVTLSFDMSVFEIFASLSTGATLVIADSNEILDGQALIDLIEYHNITIIQATPSFWNILLSNGWKGKSNLKALCGGEALTYSLIQQILPRVGEFWNCYGPTETAVYATCTQITSINPPILIGKPLNNLTIHILDNNKQMVPIGAIGEVCIGGVGVAKGYHNKPELTAEKFIRYEDSIIYKTGDLGRFLTDGNIELFGRIDNQIKLRGFRIEPGEIESLLTSLSKVKEAIVKVHKFDENDERLVGFLNVDNEFKLTKEDIHEELAKSLPTYMIPSFFQVSDGFPRLPNGKINKKALSLEIDKIEDIHEIDFESLTKTEKKLVNLWESLLKINNIDISKSFFDIGGNSLLAIRLINRIKEEFGTSLSFKSFVTFPFIIKLAKYIDGQLPTPTKAIELVHLTQEKELPLTANQKRLWLVSKFHPEIPTYIIPLTFKFSGFLNYELFEKSLMILFDRHHILYTVIKEENSEPFCEIVKRQVQISFSDYTQLPEEEKTDKVEAILSKDMNKAFDLERGPLYRLYLIKTNVDEYYFHMSIHHIIFDGWSRGILVNDLTSIYNSLVTGKEHELEKLEFQQYDYAHWEATSEVNKDSAEFWEENLKGCSPVLNFPFDFPRKEKSTGRGGHETICLTKQLSDSLRVLSKETSSSLFSTIMCGFGVLMHKYSGEDDLNIGIPVAYRPHSQLEKVVGMFVNTVVVRLRYERGSTFRELMKQTNEAAMNAIEFQDLPFENVVELVRPERIPGINPLFQVALAWQNNLGAPINLKGIRSENVKLKEGPSIFDLILYLWEKEDTIQGEFEYSADLLKQDTIIRLRDHFLDLLAKLADNPDRAIESLPMISDADKTLISNSNNTRSEYPRNMTVARLFEEQVDLFREKTALVFKDDSFSYEELNGKANQLARTLRDAGVTNNTPVGIMADKSLEMIVGILAILKAGGGYVPVDPEYPLQRIQYILEDSGCKIILLQDKFNHLSPDNIHKIHLNSPGAYNYSKSNIENINTSSDLAYIMYTSGTTGKPKGSMILQHSVIRLVRNTNYISLSPTDRILLTGAMVFDATTFEIWGALLNGATLYIVDKETILDPDALGAELDRNDISILWLTSALFTQIAEERTDIFGKLNYLLTGGDVLSAPHVNKVRKANPGLKILNCYGPTENTTFSTTYLIDRDFGHNIPIGKPIANSTAHIFDRNMNLLPVGVIGELCVGGDGLSAGYLNSEELNRSKFIQNPLNPGERLYRTGDLARWLPDGNIEFRGRIDNQLKIRGFRVELEEIEAVISEIDGVIETVVKPVKVAEGDFRLVAFLNVPESFNTETSQIASHIKTRLPGYMIPSAFRILHGFPKTINGKTDKKALFFDISEFETKPHQEIGSFTKSEKTLHAIWCETLKTDSISLTDDFFSSGGNSLSGIRLINKIRESFGVKLTFSELLSNSTISQLGKFIDARTGGSEKAIFLVHLPESGHLPLTRNQKRLWIIWKLQPEAPSYIIPSTYRFSGPLNLEMLHKSIELLFLRHHILFSVIKEENGEPFCEIVKRDIDIQFQDYTGLPVNQKEKLIQDLVSSDSIKPFDLEKGPLYRLFLIKTAADEHYLHMTIHHIIFDGWSWGILANDLSSIYNSLAAGKEPDLEDLEFQQYDYAQWETASEENKDSVEFWEENLKGCSPVLNFPFDFPRRQQSSGKGSYETISLSRTLSKALKQISREEGSSLFSILLSSLGILLHKYSGEDDLNIGMPVAYRPHSGLEKIFGMFVNTVVVRLRYDKQDTFRNLIRKANKSALDAISHQDIPFERIVEIISPERASNENPLFQIAFVWQNNLGEPMILNDIETEPVRIRQNASVFDITFSLWENGDRIEGGINYSEDLLLPGTISRLKDNYITLLNNIAENIDMPLSSFSMISDEEKGRIEEINNTSNDYPADKTIAQIFEDNASLHPDHIALSFKGESYSYRMLNERANQLARTLKSYGVEANKPVGLLAEKSLEMITALLAILKAGGCYVPIDPEYPEERIRFIIKDVNLNLLLTQKKFVRLGLEGVHNICIDSEDSYSEERSNLNGSSGPGDFAYILYTSGTTGTPKGTPVPQRGVVRLVCRTNYIDLSPDDNILLSGAIVFDASTMEIWGALLNGASLFIINKDILLDHAALADEMRKNRISTLIITSALFTHLSEFRPDIFTGLRLLVVGGDVLSISHVNKIKKENPALIFINAYGPTENSCTSTAFRIEKECVNNIPIGKPISNSTAYILDRNLKYQPIGVVGELCVGGDGLSAGYINREELNKKCFIEHPEKPGVRLYRTGDLARWLPDLNIEFRGRSDNQLKIRGFRVELEEIESVLSAIDGVIEAVVKPVKVAEGDYRLVAFLNVPVTFKTGTDEIIKNIKRRLPPYMVPSKIVYMDGFPLTVNGKVDRKALNAEPDEPEKREVVDQEKLTATEKTIYKIWCDALKTDDIVVADNFFDIGGNSLMAVSVLARIEATFNVALGLRVFFDSPRIKDIAEAVDLKTLKEKSDAFIVNENNSNIITGEI